MDALTAINRYLREFRKDYENMSHDELAEVRISLEKKIGVLRLEKRKIQQELDRRALANPVKVPGEGMRIGVPDG